MPSPPIASTSALAHETDADAQSHPHPASGERASAPGLAAAPPTPMPGLDPASSHAGPRYSRNCEPCRRRKTKCDRIRPCASCVLRSTTEFCYNDEPHPPAAPLAPSSSSAQLPRLEPPATRPRKRKEPLPQGYALDSLSDISAALTGATSRGASLDVDAVRAQLEGVRGTLNRLESLLQVVEKRDQARTASRSGSGSRTGLALAPEQSSDSDDEPAPTHYRTSGNKDALANDIFLDVVRMARESLHVAAAMRPPSLEADADTSTMPMLNSHKPTFFDAGGLLPPGANTFPNVQGVTAAGSSATATATPPLTAPECAHMRVAMCLDNPEKCAVIRERSVTWAELADVLPPAGDFEAAFDCYSTWMNAGFGLVPMRDLLRVWRHFAYTPPSPGKEDAGAVPRSVVALCLLMLALVGVQLVPGSAAEKLFSVPPHAQHPRLYALAMEICDGQSYGTFSSWGARTVGPRLVPRAQEISFTRVLVDLMTAMYASLLGSRDLLWEKVGAGCRRGQAIHLFNEKHVSWRHLTDMQKEYRRRVAHKLVFVDRWESLQFQRDWSVTPALFNVQPPRFVKDEAFDQDTGALLTGQVPPLESDASFRKRVGYYIFLDVLVQLSMHFRVLPTLPHEEAAEKTRALDTLIAYLFEEYLSAVGLSQEQLLDWRPPAPGPACEGEAADGTALNDPFRLGFIAHTWSNAYTLRSMLARPWLDDPDAPEDLRFAALVHARKVLEIIPFIRAITDNPLVCRHAVWNPDNLLTASMTFAVPFLSAECGGPGSGSSSGSSAPAAASGSHTWPSSDLDWFASKIFDTLQFFEELGSQGNRSAQVCQLLLHGLCTQRKELRQRYLASRHGRARVERMRAGRPSSGIGAADQRPHKHFSTSPHQSGTQQAQDELEASLDADPVVALFNDFRPIGISNAASAAARTEQAPSEPSLARGPQPELQPDLTSESPAAPAGQPIMQGDTNWSWPPMAGTGARAREHGTSGMPLEETDIPTLASLYPPNPFDPPAGWDLQSGTTRPSPPQPFRLPTNGSVGSSSGIGDMKRTSTPSGSTPSSAQTPSLATNLNTNPDAEHSSNSNSIPSSSAMAAERKDVILPPELWIQAALGISPEAIAPNFPGMQPDRNVDVRLAQIAVSANSWPASGLGSAPPSLSFDSLGSMGTLAPYTTGAEPDMSGLTPYLDLSPTTQPPGPPQGQQASQAAQAANASAGQRPETAEERATAASLNDLLASLTSHWEGKTH